MSEKKLTSIVKDSYGNEWSITASFAYISLVEQTPLFKNFNTKEYPDVLGNVAGQLQLIEFTDLILNNFTFEQEGEVEIPEFLGGGTMGIHNEVEHAICKQGLIAAASLAETVCFIIVVSNGVTLPEHHSFKKLIKVAQQSKLIDEIDADLLNQLRELRNSLHLHIDSFTTDFYHIEQYETAKSCLYWMLIKLLGIDERVMSIHFPYLPRRDKEELEFEV